MNALSTSCFGRSLVLPFKSRSGACYLYDAASNEIVSVSPTLWRCASEDCATSGLADEGDMVAFLEANRTTGLFTEGRPEKVDFLVSPEALATKLATEVGQIVLEMTTACNFRCKYCTYSGHYENHRQHGTALMTPDTALKAVDFFLQRNANSDHCSIGFYGGEPTLNWKAITAAVEHAKKNAVKRPIFSMTTNGYRLSERIELDFLVENEFSLLISLDGPESKNNAYRVTKGLKPTFNAVLKTLSDLRDIDENYFRTNVRISAVIAPPYDYLELKNFFDEAEILRDIGLEVSFVSPGTATFFDSADVQAQSRKSMAEDCRYDAMNKLYMDYLCDETPYRSRFLRALFEQKFLRLHKRSLFPRYGKFISANGCCLPGVRRIFVKTTGEIAMCEKVDDTLNIGHIDRGFDVAKIEAIMHSYAERSSLNCPDCVANRLCSACFASGFSMQGFELENKNGRCHEMLLSLEEDLADYCSVLERNPKAFDFMKEIVIS